MARTLSTTALQSMHAQETGEVWLVLLTIGHASLAQPIRVVNNTENIVSRGAVFLAFPFEIVLPGEDPDGITRASLRFDNVERTAIGVIRGLDSPPTVTLEVVLASNPSTVEIAFEGLTLRNVTYDALQIEGELYFESIFTEPITLTMTPSRFPGLF